MDSKRLDGILRAQLDHTLEHTHFPELGVKYEGKVRDSYVKKGRRVIIVTDRLSAFDAIVGTIPFKGQMLNQIAHYWFEETAHLAANHLISVPDPNVMVVHEYTPLKVEFVMRAYLTGVTETSIWRAYERGERQFCGHDLPDGMERYQRLPCPLLTPTTKAPKGEHDVSMSRDQLIGKNIIDAEHFDRAAAVASTLFEFGQKRAAERGLILVDTKYEMAVAPSGDIVVIDEIHTPDSSRYWYAADYQERMAQGEPPRSLDKEYVRRWLDGAGYRGNGAVPRLPADVRVEAAKRYIEIYEVVTGRAFEPNTGDPARRIAVNLRVR